MALNTTFIRLPDVIEKTGWSRSSIYAAVTRGDFPKPIKLGLRASAWISSEVDSWVSQRIAASRGDVNALDERPQQIQNSHILAAGNIAMRAKAPSERTPQP